ncbi:uncharacterized protein DS421_13g388790 [Arachis hypogaea]|nr:uncharacterized protein DS421_13g388790 [Arachis hypogaea]
MHAAGGGGSWFRRGGRGRATAATPLPFFTRAHRDPLPSFSPSLSRTSSNQSSPLASLPYLTTAQQRRALLPHCPFAPSRRCLPQSLSQKEPEPPLPVPLPQSRSQKQPEPPLPVPLLLALSRHAQTVGAPPLPPFFRFCFCFWLLLGKKGKGSENRFGPNRLNCESLRKAVQTNAKTAEFRNCNQIGEPARNQSIEPNRDPTGFLKRQPNVAVSLTEAPASPNSAFQTPERLSVSLAHTQSREGSSDLSISLSSTPSSHRLVLPPSFLRTATVCSLTSPPSRSSHRNLRSHHLLHHSCMLCLPWCLSVSLSPLVTRCLCPPPQPLSLACSLACSTASVADLLLEAGGSLCPARLCDDK